MENILGFVYRAFNHGRTPEQSRQHQKDVRHAEEEARVFERRPVSLPKTRRNLSEASLSLHPQPSCLMFTVLPPEIRQHIYTYVLGGSILHLTHISRAIVHQKLEITDHQLNDEEPPTGDIPLQMPPNIVWYDQQHRIPERPQFSTVDISLLQTCHAIYAEAISVLYNTNVFSMASPLVLLYLKDYTLLPQRFADIRHLQLIPWVYFNDPVLNTGCMYGQYDKETWPRFWQLVAIMHLRSLGLWVEYWGTEAECTIDGEWIQPLLQVKGLDMVGIQLQFRGGAYDTRRLHALEKEIETVWKGK